jgi:hypothetical protein
MYIKIFYFGFYAKISMAFLSHYVVNQHRP